MKESKQLKVYQQSDSFFSPYSFILSYINLKCMKIYEILTRLFTP